MNNILYKCKKINPNALRARNAIILIWIVLAMEIISFLFGYAQYDLIKTASSRGNLNLNNYYINDLREQIITSIYYVVYIISVITFIQWFRRAYYNLHQKISYLSYSEEWAAGSWFIPIINLYRPYKIMKELYIETIEVLTENGITPAKKLSTIILNIWWPLWIISAIIIRFYSRFLMISFFTHNIILGLKLSMINNILGIFLALVTIKIISDYLKVESQLTKVPDIDMTNTYSKKFEKRRSLY